MTPTNMRDLTYIVFGAILVCVIALILAFTSPHDVTVLYVGAASFAVGGSIGLMMLGQQRRRVDPWEYQRRLMSISGQEIPEDIQLNKTGLLYLALILEEFGETCMSVYHAMIKAGPITAGAPLNIVALLQAWAEEGKAGSMALRQHVTRLPEGYVIRLTIPSAKEIADGTTDLAVVNSGFALALGLPGAELYEEISESNLSKANPVTGLIERDASGKWIKGPGYQAPDIEAVLRRVGCNDGFGRAIY